jgi:hypothetical protein
MRESVSDDPPARVPDAAEFGMLRAMAREAVENAVRHGRGSLRFHDFWLLARRIDSQCPRRPEAVATSPPIVLLIGCGGTLIERERLDGLELPRC